MCKIHGCQVLHPVKFPFTVEINRAIFLKVPIGEVENTFNRSGRNSSGRIIETGAEKYQISNDKRQCDDVKIMSAF